MTTWAHNCDSTGKFSQIPLNQECKVCGVTSAVEATRYAGYAPLPIVKKQPVPQKKKIAALFLPFKRNKVKENEYETEFYDRHG